LRVIDSYGTHVVALDKPLFTIGRRTTSDLHISRPDVSKEHAEIARDGEQYILRDRGSRYGTFVNDQRITEQTLVSGDRIRLAGGDDVAIVFETDEPSSPSCLSEGTTEGSDLRQIAAILNGLRALGSGRVLGDVLTLVVDSAIDVTKAERGFIMLANERGELEFTIGRQGGLTLSGTSFATSTRIPREVFMTDRGQFVSDLELLKSGHGDTAAVGIRYVMCVPLRVVPMAAESAQAVQPRVIGVLYLDGRERRTSRSSSTPASLEAFATQAAIAIESARLYAEAAEKARIDRDLRVAADIQRSLLPEPTYSGANCDLAAVSIPCRTIGGDFYDYLDLANGDFAFTLGDVAGKGPAAALLAAGVQSHFVAQVAVCNDPAQTIARINTALLRRPIEARFATMFHGVLARDGRFSYCNAGQEPPLMVGRQELTSLKAGGPVLGLLTGGEYGFETVRLKPNDLVVVFSDGVTEAINTAGEEFGRERVVEVISACHGTKPETVLETVLDALREFSQGAPQSDDVSALILRYRGQA
jgi:phosphoserine phosphatase RsbU/P